MEHLKALKTVNVVFAVMMWILALAFLLLMGLPGVLAILDGELMGLVFLGAALTGAAAFGGIAYLHARVASQVEGGRGRLMQTALAVIHLMNFPIGTAFALYSLWLCWLHEPTKTSFDLHDAPL